MVSHMLSFYLVLGLFALRVYGWEVEDHEIFDLVSALESEEGKGMTFYKFLNLTKSATLEEINKAARKLALTIHPDKHPGNKTIEAKFSRLGLITAILRDSEKRNDTTSSMTMVCLGGKGQDICTPDGNPDLDLLIRKFQTAARQAAHRKGEKSSAGKSQGRKKVKISLTQGHDQEVNGGESDVPAPKSRQERRRMQQVTGSKVEKPSQPGWIDMVVEGDDVWIVADDGSELPLVESAATKPSFQRTFIPATIYRVLGVSPVSSTSAAAGTSKHHDGAEIEVKNTKPPSTLNRLNLHNLGKPKVARAPSQKLIECNLPVQRVAIDEASFHRFTFSLCS
ncbi:hypothetical protein PCASD_09703 [Puccinia coronata f. sp. avenae]|uniref:J domain-containing protein n=1 Tax=Puccinia coronata f. sp. avenae TaxID=200324 RepID=A0A2N5TF71_9BASI|nr:hypothetical protein PCASD_09703 [Puccinia coronata f. sp. avenae]